MSFLPLVTTAWCWSPSSSSAPARAMLSRKPPITLWKSCFSSRYSRYPVSRMPSVVRARNVAARRDASRRQRGRPSRATTIVVGASISHVPPTTHHQFRDVALEEHLHGPVEDRTQPRRQSGQLEHVDDLPHHPGRNAAQFQTEQIGHRSVPAPTGSDPLPLHDALPICISTVQPTTARSRAARVGSLTM